MAITISVPDALRQSVEAASGGKNTVLYDSKGYPSIMVRIPKFNLQDIDASLGSGVHPAFIVNGVEKSEIFIGKFQAIVHDGNALSLPAQDPANSYTFDQALGYCKAKGDGWHLMTNAEWAAIALWCWKNGFMPRGNNNAVWDGSTYKDPKDYSAAYERSVKATTGTDGRSLTGTGPASWCHDNSLFGIADLNGNVWEWVGGMRLNNGEIQILENNNAADNTKDQSASSTLWKAILASNGSLVAPGTIGTCKYDSVNVGTTGQVGAAQLDDVRDNSNAPASGDDGYTYNAFQSLAADTGITPPVILKALALFPIATTGLGDDGMWAMNYNERLPLRGGHWDNTSNAGVFALFLSYARSIVYHSVGFRPACVL
jgi:hypothetical protein